MKWMINKIARKEEGKGRNVWKEYGRSKVDGK